MRIETRRQVLEAPINAYTERLLAPNLGISKRHTSTANKDTGILEKYISDAKGRFAPNKLYASAREAGIAEAQALALVGRTNAPLEDGVDRTVSFLKTHVPDEQGRYVVIDAHAEAIAEMARLEGTPEEYIEIDKRQFVQLLQNALSEDMPVHLRTVRFPYEK